MEIIHDYMKKLKGLGYICPNPPSWAKFHQFLCENLKQTEPPIPFILGYWFETTAEDKMMQLSKQLYWANENDCLDASLEFLEKLESKEWNHEK